MKVNADNRRALPDVGDLTLTAGARLGRYEVLAPVGRGGMGEVYRRRSS
jgi:hypothetical protein